MLIVQKYGGSSVADRERVYNVANRIVETYKAGNQVVVVLSAQGDTTDDLIEKAREISANPSRREMDMLLSTGEQISVALMAMAIHELGYPAVSLNAEQVGIDTTAAYSNARIKNVRSQRLEQELARNNIVIVTGFQGMNKYDDVTTLGRGGSDTTAVALAAALQADLCEIYTDVDGVYTADPRVVKHAKKLDVISYDEMLEMATLGAKVLHNRSVELAKKFNVNLVVRSSLTRAEGTVVKEVDDTMERMLVNGVAGDSDISRISLLRIKDEPGRAYEIFSALAKEKVSVDVILQSIGRDGTKDISFTVARDDMQLALDTLEKNKARLGFEAMNHNENVAKLSIVGSGMATNAGVASTMFEALYDAGINIMMISTSEIRISVLIDAKELDRGMAAVHDRFIRENSRF